MLPAGFLSQRPETSVLQHFRLPCSGTACLRARYRTATVRERLKVQTEIEEKLCR